MNSKLLIEGNKSESFYHKAIKQFIFKYVSERNRTIIEKSLEKHIDNRRADVYFKLRSGEEIVVEVQNSKITVKEIIKRTEDYNEKGIHVLWILHGKGQCVASSKFPEDQKEVKIGTAENFLHRMYFGRVYYVNIEFNEEKIMNAAPFALHFSPLFKRKKRQMFHSKYDRYFIKNVNFTKIPSWNILLVEYNGYKLARFYDKNIKSVLKNEISRFLLKENRISLDKNYKYKTLKKSLLNHFNEKYGKYIILDSVSELIKEKKVKLNEKFILKIKREIK